MHQCLKCKATYSNEEVPLINGCACGSRLFLFIRNPEDIKQAEKYREELEQKIKQIDKERKVAVRVRKPKAARRRKPQAASRKPRTRKKAGFGIETIKVHGIGVYSIHLKALMEGAPIIVLSKSGSYIISFPSLFGEKELELPLK